MVLSIHIIMIIRYQKETVMALMLKGQLPEFQEYVGFHRDCSSRILKVRVFGESSLLGMLRMEILEVYKKQEKDGDSGL